MKDHFDVSSNILTFVAGGLTGATAAFLLARWTVRSSRALSAPRAAVKARPGLGGSVEFFESR